MSVGALKVLALYQYVLGVNWDTVCCCSPGFLEKNLLAAKVKSTLVLNRGQR